MARPANLSNAVYEQLKGSIESGEFPQGLKLPTESTLCDRFGVSRPVVRSVMERLRDEGVIETVRGSGSFVLKGKSPEAATANSDPVNACSHTMMTYKFQGIGDIIKCQETRMAFEGEMAALAAERRDQADIDAMEQALREIIENNISGTSTVDADMKFHETIVLATKNDFAIALYETMRPHVKIGINMSSGLYTVLPDFAVRHGLQEHRAILEAIKAGDPERARWEMRNHIGFFGDQLGKYS
ncbi:FadR family transcriptional regulator [Rhodobacteraceae bacterium RKSG542]|uniref:FadR/GntR family transcriptional regulator n=1 Tax=Pseudovibrio flavus TaxID=2529854 RepID=UPI0012BC5BBA|nr:FadR/GntR family transcriptional regulator [Pseudovibrio flavus]MTI16026.1 FadR family transcriptional regulator [Pseudovibrio flavus]